MKSYAVTAFKALAHDIRLAAFRLLIKEGLEGVAAGKIALKLGVPASTLSTHLNQLERAGLIQSWRNQQKIMYAVNLEGTQDLIQFLVRDCCGGKPEICGYQLKLSSNPSKSVCR